MTRPRSTLVSASETPYYHCIGRCVRRAFLCGEDPLTGKSFEHRKSLILQRLDVLTRVFALDLCAYALMSNHYHLVVKLVPERAVNWSDREVVERWRRLYSGPPCVESYLKGEPLTESEHESMATRVPLWRSRLSDLSWFMRCLNEYIARIANGEDECTGRFWEGRFKSQALLDEQALLTVMTYVDLNPVRARLADSIAKSEFTSANQRLVEASTSSDGVVSPTKPRLLPFVETLRNDSRDELPFNLHDYFELLQTTTHAVRAGEQGTISETTRALLTTLQIEPDGWLQSLTGLHSQFCSFIGSPRRLSALAERRGWRWVRGQVTARRLYCRPGT